MVDLHHLIFFHNLKKCKIAAFFPSERRQSSYINTTNLSILITIIIFNLSLDRVIILWPILYVVRSAHDNICIIRHNNPQVKFAGYGRYLYNINFVSLTLEIKHNKSFIQMPTVGLGNTTLNAYSRI